MVKSAETTTAATKNSTTKEKKFTRNVVSKPLKKPRTTKGVKPAPAAATGKLRDLPTEKLNAARPGTKPLKPSAKKKPAPKPLPNGEKRGRGRPKKEESEVDKDVKTGEVISPKSRVPLVYPTPSDAQLAKQSVRDAKKAIAMFVDNNAGRLQEWLDAVACGVVDDEGRYVVPPDPLRAFAMFQSVIEYHIPKLARQELVGSGGGAIQIANLNLKGLSTEELQAIELLLTKAIINDQAA